jgi:hypothetical protein
MRLIRIKLAIWAHFGSQLEKTRETTRPKSVSRTGPCPATQPIFPPKILASKKQNEVRHLSDLNRENAGRSVFRLYGSILRVTEITRLRTD